MTHDGRLWIELETGETGPRGRARDAAGRSRSFSGWLELIALIESPSAERTHLVGGSSPDGEGSSMPERASWRREPQ